MLILAADRQATIGVLCFFSGVHRVNAAVSAVIRGITAATACVCMPEGAGCLSSKHHL